MSIVNRLPSGGGNASSGLVNFPLTISLNEPTPESIGHIWAKTSVTYSKVKLSKALIESEDDDTLILLIGDKGSLVSGKQKLNTKGSNSPSVSVVIDDFEYGANASWNIHYVGKDDFITEVKLSAPFCLYGKKDGVTDLEEGYIWDGEQWAVISKKGYQFAVFPRYPNDSYPMQSYCPLDGAKIFNYTTNTIEETFTIGKYSQTFVSGETKSRPVYRVFSCASDEYIWLKYGLQQLNTQSGIYKRNGIEWDLYWSDTEIVNYNGLDYIILQNSNGVNHCVISNDGMYIVAMMYQKDGYSTGPAILVRFKNNGTTFVFDKVLYDSGSNTCYDCRLKATKNLEFISLYRYTYVSGNYYSDSVRMFKNLDGEYDITVISSSSLSAVAFSPDENYMFGSDKYIYQIDYENKNVIKKVFANGFNTNGNIDNIDVVPTTDGKFCILHGYTYDGASDYKTAGLSVYDPITNTCASYTYDNSVINLKSGGNTFSLSVDGKYLYILYYDGTKILKAKIFSMNIDHSIEKVVFTEVAMGDLFDFSFTSGKPSSCRDTYFDIVSIPGTRVNE